MTELFVDNKKGKNPIIAAQSFYQGLKLLTKKGLTPVCALRIRLSKVNCCHCSSQISY
jgi:hypothetical protein